MREAERGRRLCSFAACVDKYGKMSSLRDLGFLDDNYIPT